MNHSSFVHHFSLLLTTTTTITRMSCFLPEKKKKQQQQQQLLPSKKAWRSFTSKLQSKLQKLTRLKNIEQAATVLRQLPRRSPLYALRLKKKLCIKQLQHHNHCRNFETTIYIDGLFRSQDERMVAAADRMEAPMEVKEEEAEEESATCLATEDASSSSSSCAANSACSCSSPVSEASFSVDERAEMFIAKVKQDMRLQKQRSIEDYLEMLARGL